MWIGIRESVSGEIHQYAPARVYRTMVADTHCKLLIYNDLEGCHTMR